MLDHATPILSGLQLPNEVELQRVIQAGVHGAGRRSVHPGDRAAAERVADQVLQALRQARYVILKQPEDDA
jgi:hypothetical protein